MASLEHEPMLAETLMLQAFNLPRTPRSKPYKEGVQWVLDFRIRGFRPPCPYESGTAAADAFFAGQAEGHAIWQAYQAANPAKFGGA